MESGPRDAGNEQKSQGKSVDDITWSHGSGGKSSSRYLSPVAWAQILDVLALAGRVDYPNHMFLVLTACAVKDGLRMRDADRSLYLANVQRLLDDSQAVETAAFLVTHGVLEGSVIEVLADAAAASEGEGIDSRAPFPRYRRSHIIRGSLGQGNSHASPAAANPSTKIHSGGCRACLGLKSVSASAPAIWSQQTWNGR
ncbi:hypothetical protein B0H11DRAFT_2398623 [Mycena galericulata]|nr:hypothetical protein B0H11DRAFT_2398623 [Mycena galericulata]